MPATMEVIIEQVIIELSQVPGASTQIYGTPRIQQYVQDAFDLCFLQCKWAAYSSFWTGTLDGVTGRLTADIIPLTPTANVPITEYSNILNCYIENTNSIIRALPSRMNPNTLTTTSAGRAKFRVADYFFPNRPIKFLPVNATGSVVMEVYQEPLHPIAQTDILYLDQLMLVLGACYLYAADDGTNPGQINKFQSLFTKRMSDMVSAENDAPLLLSGSEILSSADWWEA